MKLLYKVGLFCLLFVCVERFCHWQTQGFTLLKIQSSSRAHSEKEVAFLQKEQLQAMQRLLSQPFSYLSSGGSCYAFQSADGLYVLKVFKQHHLYPLSWVNGLPMPLSWKTKLEQYRYRRARVFRSCLSAFYELRESTGLVYIHLNRTQELGVSLTLIDKIGIAHAVVADDLEFFLQEKAEPAYAHINRLMKEGDLRSAQQAVDQILELSATIAQKGYHDGDPNVETNLGFVGNRAIKIDIGPFIKDARCEDALFAREQLIEALGSFRKWLKEQHPELYHYLKMKEDAV